MDRSVTGFFSKNPGENYAETYRLDHGPRLQAIIDCYGLKELRGARILDIGGGLGFLGELLPGNDYTVVDGADILDDMKLCHGEWYKADLNHNAFGSDDGDHDLNRSNSYPWDIAFCLEVLEHLSSPYDCLVETKKLVKRDGTIYISIPTPEVWHNTLYCGLLWPVQNFMQFLEQMALPIIDFWEYKPQVRGWPAYVFQCRNADWRESKMLFPKNEEKFQGQTPLSYTNL